jgi:hypothetical protein
VVTVLPYPRPALVALATGVAVIAWVFLTPPGGVAGAPAANLTAKVVCDGDVLTVTFSWSSSRSGLQWLDISSQDNGFAPGTFTGIGPFDSARTSYEWNDAAGNVSYYARVNTVEDGQWAPTPTLSLTTPICGAPPASAEMETLRASIEAEVARWSFETAVAVTDLQTGETISVNGDRRQFAGCALNFFVLMQAVIDVQHGLYEEWRVGNLISATIFGSNPVTARDILLISGNGDVVPAMQRVNELISRLGLTDTFYDHPPAYWPAMSLEGRDNLTTALDMNEALAGLWHGTELTPEWRRYFFEKLTGVKPGLNYLVPAGVTDGVVGHKNGFFWLPEGYIDNDAGIVTFERGGQTYAYALTFLSQAVPTKYGDIPLGQTVSSLVWEHFNRTYP